MNSKQQIFWTAASAIVAAVIGSIFTVWYSKPSTQSSGKILYWSTSRAVNSAQCSATSPSEPCSLVAVDFKNSAIDPTGSFRAIIDYKPSTGLKEVKISSSVEGGYNFISSDIVSKRTTPTQDTVEFRRFPGMSSATYTAFVPGFMDGGPQVLIEGVDYQNPEEVDGHDLMSKFFVFLSGLLILPIFAAISAFFSWLSKEKIEVTEGESDG